MTITELSSVQEGWLWTSGIFGILGFIIATAKVFYDLYKRDQTDSLEAELHRKAMADLDLANEAIDRDLERNKKDYLEKHRHEVIKLRMTLAKDEEITQDDINGAVRSMNKDREEDITRMEEDAEDKRRGNRIERTYHLEALNILKKRKPAVG